MVEVDEEMKAVFSVVQVAGHVQRHMAETLKPFGLTPVKLNCLRIIKYIGGPKGITPQELGKRQRIDKGNVTHLLDKLERRGWVIRLRDGPDRRWRLVKLTPQGEQLLDQVRPVYDETIRRLTSVLPEVRQRELAGILKEWRDVLEG